MNANNSVTISFAWHSLYLPSTGLLEIFLKLDPLLTLFGAGNVSLSGFLATPSIIYDAGLVQVNVTSDFGSLLGGTVKIVL
jgi:hypothetical protein